MASVQVIVTCEHGGNRIPAAYRSLFRGHEALLNTHRGFDAGALTLARFLARALDVPLFAATTSRLLVDLNRTLGHPGLYSDMTRAAPAAVRRDIVVRHYTPYRQAAEAGMTQALARGARVVHIACHSFTPELDGVVRTADIGLLYDPARASEVELCKCWQTALQRLAPQFRVRRNYPYRGTSDGFTAYLRRRIPAGRYVGIEIEINQTHVAAPYWRALCKLLAQTLRSALAAG